MQSLLQGRVWESVTNIEASDVKIHISGGEVKLRNDGPDASEKGNMFSVSKDADRQGELIFTFVPVTSGSAHILVSTQWRAL